MSMMEHYADGRVPFYGVGGLGGKIGANTQRPDIGSSEQAVVCTPEVSLYQTMVDGGKMNPSSINGQQVAGGFQCGFCGKTFEQKNTFQNHLRSHREGEDPYQCDICGKTFAVPARLTRHYRTHTGEKPYQCEYCNKSFSVKENLSVHRRIHTKERPYKCEVCDRAFEHSGKLHRHMRIHTGERPHRCQICQKTFIQSGQLVIHMRTHTGEKPYVCKVCNKGFTCSKQLKVHTRTHTGEKPYTCDICGKSFGYNHVLKLHQVAHYGEKVYKCTLCNGTFNSKKALENHIKTHSSSSPMMSSMVDSPLSPDRDLELSPVQSLPMSSDKENRGDTSDSEISSQSSPLVIDTSKSSPSPPTFKGTFNTATQQSLNLQHQHRQQQQHHQQQQQQHQLPGYPMMLPPGIEVRTEPQKRTTFLYVTSKLPQQQQHQQQQPQNHQQNGRYGGHQTLAAAKLYSTPSYPQQQHQQQQQQKYPPVNVVNVNSTLPPAAILERERLINQSASIRDKVLAFTEKFGYGLPSPSSSSNSSNSPGSSGSLQAESNFLSNIRNRFDLPENLTTSTTNYSNGRYNNNSNNNNKSYAPSGVLALALTRGSKAVVQGLSNGGSTNNVNSPTSSTMGSIRDRYSSSPPDLSVDFSMAISRRSDSFSSTPRSTPPASSSSDEESVSGSSPSRKRTNSSNDSGGSGPRKRSSLILEKYAQENPQSPSSASSILSQRLRLSSVIQYAEKCT